MSIIPAMSRRENNALQIVLILLAPAVAWGATVIVTNVWLSLVMLAAR